MGFQKGEYYKHKNGRDAVMYIVEICVEDGKFDIFAAWCSLSYDGGICMPETIQRHKIPLEDAKNWELYEEPA